MEWEQRCIRLCAAVLICAVVLRLWSAGALAPVGRALQSQQAASFLIYLQTGRVVRQVPEPEIHPPVVKRCRFGCRKSPGSLPKKPRASLWITTAVSTRIWRRF